MGHEPRVSSAFSERSVSTAAETGFTPGEALDDGKRGARTPIFEDLVTIGRIVKPQGRKGELAVEVMSDRPERFGSLQRAFVRGEKGLAREVIVTRSWPHKGRFVLKLEGVDSIDQAEAYRGMEIRIDEDELDPLPEGSYYHHQLKGLRVEDPEGRPLGVVQDVMTGAGDAPILVVKGEKSELLLPLADSFVRRVDREQGRIVAVKPEFLDDGVRT
jgi:16S rRNA processing protein RimM